MLSLLACYSMYPCLAVWAWSMCALYKARTRTAFAKPIPRLRIRLWNFSLLVAVLAVDFAVVPMMFPAKPRLQVCACDAAVALAPFLYWSVARAVTVLDLWSIAIIFGLASVLMLPAVVAH